jgi:hypothetical protein
MAPGASAGSSAGRFGAGKGTPGGRAGGGACDSETAGQRFWVRVKEHGLTNWGGQVAAKGKGRNKNAHLRPEAGTTGARRAGSRP